MHAHAHTRVGVCEHVCVCYIYKLSKTVCRCDTGMLDTTGNPSMWAGGVHNGMPPMLGEVGVRSMDIGRPRSIDIGRASDASDASSASALTDICPQNPKTPKWVAWIKIWILPISSMLWISFTLIGFRRGKPLKLFRPVSESRFNRFKWLILRMIRMLCNFCKFVTSWAAARYLVSS